MGNWQAPAGHPISVEEAKALMAGDLGDVYRSILKVMAGPSLPSPLSTSPYWPKAHQSSWRQPFNQSRLRPVTAETEA